MNKVLILFVATWMLTACAHHEVQPEAAPVAMEPSAPSIDVDAIARALNMERPLTELGYQEKSFNTCEMGYGFSRTHDCRRQVLAVVNFRLQCRTENGNSFEVISSDSIRAIAAQTVRWTLKPASGETQTDGEGYAQFKALLPASGRAQRVRLAVGSQFLYMRAGELTRVVAPPEWCQ